MAITYVIYENPLTPGQFRALTRAVGTAELDDVVDRLLTRGSTVTRADTLAVLTGFFELVTDMVLEGYRVRTPLATFSVSVQGIFDGADDRFWRGRHAVKAVVRPGPAFKRAMRYARPLKGEARDSAPLLAWCEDVASGTTDSLLTPGGIARLRGRRLRFDPGDADQGVFLIPEGEVGGTRALQLAQNKPAELVFLVPALAPGRYTVAVRSRHRSRWLKQGQLGHTLTVVEPDGQESGESGRPALTALGDEPISGT
jgi:hypothetical protein